MKTNEHKKLEMFPKNKMGAYRKKTKCTRTQPRDWTEDEIKYAVDAYDSGYTLKEISQALDRSYTSVRIKLERHEKDIDVDTYNDTSILEKYATNMDFYTLLGCPSSCLDVCCGTKSFWENNTEMKVITNDKNKNITATYNMMAERLIAKMYSEYKNFDIVDVDCFGDPFKCIDLAVQISKKGLILTFGLKKSKQFSRDDVGKKYNIDNVKDLNIDNLIDYVKNRAFIFDKEVDVAFIHKNSSIWRVYFTVKHRTTPKYDFDEKIKDNNDAMCA